MSREHRAYTGEAFLVLEKALELACKNISDLAHRAGMTDTRWRECRKTIIKDAKIQVNANDTVISSYNGKPLAEGKR